MVSKYDSIIVSTNDMITVLGRGYESIEEIEVDIEKKFDNPGDYKYGTLDQIGSFTIPELPNKFDILPENTIDKINSIVEKAEKSMLVTSAYSIEKRESRTKANLYGERLFYGGLDYDFILNIDSSLFSDLPLSSLDLDVGRHIKENIFDKIIGDEAIYLGFDSGYAKRGRREPYVRVIGRVNRETNKDYQLRKISDEEDVLGIYYTDNNLTKIPIQFAENYNYNYTDEVDAICILDFNEKEDNDEVDFDILSIDALNFGFSASNAIEDKYDFNFCWIGKVSYKRNFHQLGLGLKFEEN